MNEERERGSAFVTAPLSKRVVRYTIMSAFGAFALYLFFSYDRSSLSSIGAIIGSLLEIAPPLAWALIGFGVNLITLLVADRYYGQR